MANHTASPEPCGNEPTKAMRFQAEQAASLGGPSGNEPTGTTDQPMHAPSCVLTGLGISSNVKRGHKGAAASE